MATQRPLRMFAAAPAIAAASAAWADTAPPTRAMSPDRPDTTESPITVPQGRVQLEMSLIEFSREDEGPRHDAFAYAPANLKFGIHEAADIQFLFTPYARAQESGGDDQGGIGDLGIRLKLNLWGNDAGTTALALMPYIIFPSGAEGVSADAYSAGLIVPFAVDLPGDFALGLMAEFAGAWPEDGGDFEADFIHTAALSRDLTEGLGAFIEYAGVAPMGRDDAYAASFNTGLTLAVSQDMQWDAGVNIGLTDEAEDLVLFIGLTVRY